MPELGGIGCGWGAFAWLRMAVHSQAAGMGWGCSLSEPEKEFIWCGCDAGWCVGGSSERCQRFLLAGWSVSADIMTGCTLDTAHGAWALLAKAEDINSRLGSIYVALSVHVWGSLVALLEQQHYRGHGFSIFEESTTLHIS